VNCKHTKTSGGTIIEAKADRLIVLITTICCGVGFIQDTAVGAVPVWPITFPISFEYKVIENDAFGHREVGDIDGDGFNDIVSVNQTESHGVELKSQAGDKLVWYKYPNWKKYTISQISEFNDYNQYSSCDMEIADIDGDGDIDVIGRLKGTDEEQGLVCWFENPRPDGEPAKGDWKRHGIGKIEYVKEIELADFNADGKLDVVTRTSKMLYIWLQNDSDNWHKITIDAPGKEGATVGDIDGDGDPDIVLAGYWVETPEDPVKGRWESHNIDRKWYTQKWRGKGNWRDNCSKVRLADMNGDGCLDVIICSSEMCGYPVSWYKAPGDPKKGVWKENVIGQIDWCHNLQVADMDNDGDIDVVAAEMPRYSALSDVVVFLNNGDSVTWRRQVIANTGNYSLQIGDLGNDGDMDIIGLRRYNLPPIEVWENKSSDNKNALNKWTYIQVDDKRGKWGDYAEPKWMRYFGLALGDLNGDGYKDMASGRYMYHNPGKDMSEQWKRVDFGLNVDAMVIVDVDNDEFGDVVGQALPDVYWLEAEDAGATAWKSVKIGTLPATDHVNGQGYGLAQILPGGKPEVLFTCGGGIYYFVIPDEPEAGNWPAVHITGEAYAEGIGIGDIDGDGDLDVAAGVGEKGEGGKPVAWWENPGNNTGDWVKHEVGRTRFMGDRFKIAEINGDGKPDIVVTEERWPGPDPDASLYWFQKPAEATSRNWECHTVVTEYSLNNLNVADMDKDGDVDIIVCEHKGPNEKLQIWENDGRGNFTENLLDQGKESHLGCKIADLDGDGDLDIASQVWDDYQYLHLWRNDALSRATTEGEWREAWGDYQFMRDLRQ